MKKSVLLLAPIQWSIYFSSWLIIRHIADGIDFINAELYNPCATENVNFSEDKLPGRLDNASRISHESVYSRN